MRFLFFSLFLLIIPLPLLGSVVISEIMYDLEGSDTKREWVEVHNIGETSVDFSSWRFFEGDTNHKLSTEGDSTLIAGGYAVIADDPNVFLTDWPDFSGLLFDSSFSFHNTGETIGLRDADLTDIDMVTYSNEWGGNGDGNSLQKIDGTWVSAVATPGSKNYATATETENDSSMYYETPAAPSGSGGSRFDFPVEPQIIADAGEDRTVAVGADSVFKGSAVGLAGNPLEGDARYVWNFGDGQTKEGRNVFHYYQYPGTYTVVLDVSIRKHAASDRVIVTARPADVAISLAAPDRILIQNNDSGEIDLSWWIVKSGETDFVMPKDTLLLAGSTLQLSSEVTGLADARLDNTFLLYPNGMLAYAHEPEPIPPRVIESTPVSLSVSAPTPAKPPDSESAPTFFVVEELTMPFVEREIPQASTTDALAASVYTSLAPRDDRSSSLIRWPLALAGLLALAVLAAFGLKKSRTDPHDISEWKIETKE